MIEEYRDKPIVNAKTTRHKMEVKLTIEYNANIPPYAVERDLFGFTKEQGDRAYKQTVMGKALEMAINPDYMSQTRDTYSIRIVDVRVDGTKDIQ